MTRAADGRLGRRMGSPRFGRRQVRPILQHRRVRPRTPPRRGGFRSDPVAGLDAPAEPLERGDQGAHRARVGAVLQQAADQPPLGGLVEVTDHGAATPGLVQHPQGDHPARQVRLGPPERGVRRGPEVDEQARARRPRGRRPRGGRATGPRPGRARAGRRRRRGGRPGCGRRAAPARTARRRPRPGSLPGAWRRRAGRPGQRVVEDAAVDAVGPRGRCGRQLGVAADQVGQPGGQAEDCPGPLGSSRQSRTNASST